MSAAGFSYAQAARGQPTHQTIASLLSNTSATPPLASGDKDGENPISSASPVASSVIDTGKAPARALSHDISPSPRKVGSDTPSSPAASSTLVGTTAESASNFSLDEATPHVVTGDKPSRVSTPGTRSPTSDETAKKGGRKAKTTAKNFDTGGELLSLTEDSVKDKVSTKAELAPAPLPAVNVWSQRLMEQAAKGKQSQTFISERSNPGNTTGPLESRSASGNGAKVKDARKQGFVSTTGDETVDANGVSINNLKAPTRRPNESFRGSADQPRRNGPRGPKTAEKDEKLGATSRRSLPSVHDAASWPTPELSTGTEDSKAKLTDKAESADKDGQDEAASSKSRKKGWLPLPFVPTVNFQTPVPNVRGSKPKTGNRGGRDALPRGSYNDGNATNGLPSHGKPVFASLSAVDVDPDALDAAKEGSGSGNALPSRPSTQGPSAHKRLPTDVSHNHVRETRKPSAVTLPDKPKEPASDQQTAAGKAGYDSKGSHANDANGEMNAQYRQTTYSAHPDRRPSIATKSTGQHSILGRDFSPHDHRDQNGQVARERTETRSDRPSRGGFRGGRGGSSALTQHPNHSTYQPTGQRMTSNTTYSAGVVLPPTAAPFNPQPQQFSYGNTHSSTRPGARAPSRSQIPPQPQGSFINRLQNSNSRLYLHSAQGVPNIPGEVQMQHFPLPAFNPYVDAELLHGLTLQVEYYFSLDNLCKDVFLRRKMNDQGFVPLLVIAKFKRMSDLAPSLDFIRAACEQSENLDYVVDQEQNEWIRSRFLWGGFVLPPEDRDEDARKPGPDLRTALFRSVHSRPHQAYLHSMVAGGHPTMPQSTVSPLPYPASGHELFYSANAGGPHAAHTSVHSSNDDAELIERMQRGGSQLSATVPDFSPGMRSGAPTTLEDFQTYPDEQVEKLVVQVGSGLEPETNECMKHSYDRSLGPISKLQEKSSSQANGTSNANVILEDRVLSDGASQSDTSTSSAAGQKLGGEPYPELRAKALQHRSDAKPGETPVAMKHLYRFWSSCLPTKFNVRMYEEFRGFALEDAHRNTPSDFGLGCLLRYYDQVLFGSNNARPYPAVFVPHHLEARKLSESLKPRANGASAV